MSDCPQKRFSAPTMELLQEAGWVPGRDVSGKLQLPDDFVPFPAALNVLNEFGNLRIGKHGPGVECARIPLILNPMLATGEFDRFIEYENTLRIRLYPLGETGDGHSFIAIDEQGRIFLLFENISFVDNTFDAALDNLLNGTKPPILIDSTGRFISHIS